jgi:hypothetical protein
MSQDKKIDPNEAVEYIYKYSKEFAKAKSERVYLEEFRKSKKSMLMTHSPEPTIGGQERDAYRHPEYLQLLEGLKAAVETEEKLRWHLIAAQARIDIWRTTEASNRGIDRATQ